MVPAPTVTPPVSVHWTPGNTAVVVWCQSCRGGSAIYTTVLRIDAGALVCAVESHRKCMESQL
jgi:hypothetical protein